MLVLVACGPSDGPKGDKGDTGPAGPAGAQGSAGPTGTTGQDVIEGVGTGQITVSGATNFSAIPGLTITVDVPQNAKLHVDTSGGIQCTGTGAAYSAVDIAVFVDGSITNAQRRVVAANTTGVAQMIATWSFGRFLLVTPGSHTIEVRAAGGDPAMTTANVSSASAPQLQGVLTATILKL
jgi:hypothetical protein